MEGSNRIPAYAVTYLPCQARPCDCLEHCNAWHVVSAKDELIAVVQTRTVANQIVEALNAYYHTKGSKEEL
jgi:hypothetical protein